MDKFKRAYERLNTEQREAVDNIDGPLLVIAGPGTGKTELLSVRVANILQKTDAAPYNILCLTFTNKAATSMRNRLFDLMGADAYKVIVRTFHSFATDIMAQYPDYFWSGARLGTVPDAVQLEILQSILSELPLNNPLAAQFAGKFTGLSSIQEALKLTKEAGLTPDKLNAIIDANLAYIDIAEPVLIEHLEARLNAKKLDGLYAGLETALPEQPIDDKIAPLTSLRTVLLAGLAYAIEQDEGTGVTKKTGDWKKKFIKSVNGQKAMVDERNRNAWWRALAGVYASYRTTLHARGYYDYADMLVEVITQLEQNPELRSDVQEQFLYVLIDEFQDTTPAQLRLAHLVADHETNAGKPNLLAVGDDDQSIFKFNGAELNNMLTFRSNYGIKKPVVLTKNYRSSQLILDTAKIVAEQAKDRIVNREADITKDLVAANPPKTAGVIDHLQYPTREHQLSAVARKIAGLHNETGTIAVLARGHESLIQLTGLLQAQGVPVRYEKQNNILEHPAVRQILLLAEVIVAIQDGDESKQNVLLSEMLRHPMWQVEPKTLWQLAIDNRFAQHWLKTLLEHDNAGLKETGNCLLEMARIASQESLPVVLQYLMGLREHELFKSPFRDYFFKHREVKQDYLEALSAVKILCTVSNEFSQRNEADLADFVRFIRLNQENGKPVTDESVYMTGKKAVELMTVHKAKGLEFDIVFVVDAVENVWKPASGGRKPPANLPLQANGDDIDDYVRLFYVAVTRAKHSLHVSSYAFDGLGKEVLPAPFARAALIPELIPLEVAGDPITVLEEAQTWPDLDAGDEKLLLEPILDAFSLSPTSLIHFLDIVHAGPKVFLERHLLRLPGVRSVVLSYGIAFHSAMERAQILQNKNVFDLDEIQMVFEDALQKQHLTKQELEQHLRKGTDALGVLFHDFGYEMPNGSQSEQSLSSIMAGGVAISGKLDRIDTPDPTTLVIVDYKTGKPLKSFETNAQNDLVKAWRHRTQLIYYALLAEQTPRFSSVKNIECQMVYVETPDVKGLVRNYFPTKEEIERTTRLATAVWKKIKACDFPDISKYEKTIEGITKFEEDLLNGDD